MKKCVINGVMGQFEGSLCVSESKLEFFSQQGVHICEDEMDSTHHSSNRAALPVLIVEIPFTKIAGRFRGAHGLPRYLMLCCGVCSRE
jgi:hypothetical protein